MPKATYQQTKQHNRDFVLQTIFANQPTSRAEVARLTELTRTTVSEVVNGLLSEGLVEEVGRGASIGGKSPTLLRIIPDSRYRIGLDLGQEHFVGAIVNLQGEIVEKAEMAVGNANGSEALEAVYQLTQQLVQTRRKPIVAIGVGTPGLVNTHQGIVLQAVNLAWSNLPMRELLQKKFKIPVAILNDSQAVAMGEYLHRRVAEERNMIAVNANYGIGAGIIIRGRLFQGDHGSAGEIGHAVVQENGTHCRCGKRGCLETVSSAQGVLRVLGMDSIDEALSAFAAGEPRARQVVGEAGQYLGVALANLISTLNIHTIILNGVMTHFGDAWLESVRAALQQTALARLAEGARLETGALGDQACVLGAAAYPLLHNPAILFRKASR